MKSAKSANTTPSSKLKGKTPPTTPTPTSANASAVSSEVIQQIHSDIRQIHEKLSIIKKELGRVDRDIGHRVIAISETVGVVQDAAQKLVASQ